MRRSRVGEFDHKKLASKRGFSLLELTVVLCVIAILFAGSAIQYQKRIDDSRREVLRHQSQTFQRMVENIRAISVLQRSHIVDLGTGVFVGVNHDGWAVSANTHRDVSYRQASENACRSLWLYLFSGSSTKNDKSGTKLPEDFDISLIDNYICRYKQFQKQEDSHFLDYDVRTGNVVAIYDQ